MSCLPSAVVISNSYCLLTYVNKRALIILSQCCLYVNYLLNQDESGYIETAAQTSVLLENDCVVSRVITVAVVAMVCKTACSLDRIDKRHAKYSVYSGTLFSAYYAIG